MAKKRKAKANQSINRSEAIREYLTNNPQATPKVVIAALAEEGIEVKAGLVSFVKNKMQHAPGRAARGKIAVADLMEIKKVADRLGGIAQLKRAIDALERLT